MCKWTVGAMVVTGAMLVGCGYTDLEMAAKQRQIDALAAQVAALKAAPAPAPACRAEAKRASAAVPRPLLSSR